MNELLNQKLNGSKVLFIGCEFYHYFPAIVAKISSYGAEVTPFHEKESSFKQVIIDNYFRKQMDKLQDNHYNKILRKVQGKAFDFLFVIKGYKMKPWFVEALKEMNPGMKTILYQWDSVDNWECDYRHLIPHFDKTFTFDYADAAKLGLPYVPTFHTDEFLQVPDNHKRYDFIFCTSYTPEKYSFFQELIKFTDSHKYITKAHIYIGWKRFLSENLRGNKIKLRDISFKRINKYEYLDLLSKSSVIVDFSRTTQTGITMRVIDGLALGKRVITNNSYAAHEPDFDASQVILYHAENFVLPDSLNQYASFPKKDYSMDKWLSNLFSCN